MRRKILIGAGLAVVLAGAMLVYQLPVSAQNYGGGWGMMGGGYGPGMMGGGTVPAITCAAGAAGPARGRTLELPGLCPSQRIRPRQWPRLRPGLPHARLGRRLRPRHDAGLRPRQWPRL